MYVVAAKLEAKATSVATTASARHGIRRDRAESQAHLGDECAKRAHAALASPWSRSPAAAVQ
jgi:hypothetical protein